MKMYLKMRKRFIIFSVALVLLLVAIQISVSRAESDSCPAKLDVIIAIDRSASMNYTSKCDWWQLKCINSPSCSQGYTWVKNTTYNQTQGLCAAKNQSVPHQSVWTDYGPNRIAAAKLAAKNFIDLLGADEQSGLVTFANTATLDKPLSNNHTLTKTTIDSSTTSGSSHDISGAINLSNLELQSPRARADARKAIILLTNGTDLNNPIPMAEAAAAAGIKIFTIGLGSEINSTMLQTIASTTGGKYYFTPTANELNSIFASLNPDVCTQQPVCGDGIKNGAEQCDGTDGLGEHQSCSGTCTLINLPYCGDGIINGSEQCDDGNTTGGDGCSATCQTEVPASVCGNGTVESGEQCDDSNKLDGDGCSAICQIEIPAPAGTTLKLYDANGQDLGILVNANNDYTYTSFMKLNNGQGIIISFDSNGQLQIGRSVELYFTQENCGGEPLIPNSYVIHSKNELLDDPSHTYGYFVVRPDTKAPRTALSHLGQNGNCVNFYWENGLSYLISNITLPFTSPAWPLEVRAELNGQGGEDGINCWDLNGNGINDPAEDINQDGSYNALDCKGAKGDAGAQGLAEITGTDNIAFIGDESGSPTILKTDGTIWRYTGSPKTWVNYPQLTLPIPTSEILQWRPNEIFLDKSGNIWLWIDGWVNTGRNP